MIISHCFIVFFFFLPEARFGRVAIKVQQVNWKRKLAAQGNKISHYVYIYIHYVVGENIVISAR